MERKLLILLTGIAASFVSPVWAEGNGNTATAAPAAATTQKPVSPAPVAATKSCNATVPCSSGDSSEHGNSKEKGDSAFYFEFLLKVLGLVIWPITLAYALWYIGRRQIRNLLSSIKRISGAGIELDLNQDRVREVRESFHESYESFKTTINKECALQAQRYSLDDYLQRAADRIIALIVTKNSTAKRVKFRATIHIQDIVFRNFLYQLLDYYPRSRSGRSGRRFSIRYGVIGKVWRTRKSLGVNKVPEDVPTLVETWGMTEPEAREWDVHPFNICIYLAHGAQPLGVIYLDGDKSDLLKNEDEMAELISSVESSQEVKELIGALNTALTGFRAITANLEIDKE